jgi:beta-phosphoglucomutase
MNKVKAIIFDLDGVLCSTDEYHYRAWKALADRLGIYFDRTINNRLRGVSRMASLDIVLEKSDKTYSDEEKVAFAKEKNDIYVQLLDNITEADASEDVRYTLKELKKRGIKIAIGSSSKNTPLILKRLGIYDWFDAISDGNNITKSKPDPEVFVKAAEMLKLKPQDCMIVEDAFSGIDAGANGGFRTIAIGDATKYDRPDYKVQQLSDILKIV